MKWIFLQLLPSYKTWFIICSFFLGAEFYIDRLITLNGVLNTFIYLSLFFFVFGVAVFTSKIGNIKIRCLWGGIFAISLFLFETMQRVMGEFISYPTFTRIVAESAFVVDAFNQYNKAMITPLIQSILLILGICISPKKTYSIHPYYFHASPFILLILLSGLMFLRGGGGGNGLPPILTPFAYGNLMVYESLNNNIGERSDVEIARSESKLTRDIILIMDESIRGDYLDINSKLGVNSALNLNYDTINIFNYGIAASISNCSRPTNVVVRYGGTRDDYLKHVNTMPSFWQYAKNSQMNTVYIDAQRTDGQLQNAMDEDERRDIDEFIQLGNISIVNRDQEVSTLLVDYINNQRQEFIYVNKVGAHFPVHDKYPSEVMAYRPVLKRGRFEDISDISSTKLFSGDWDKYKNSYRNTLLWNVGEFFSNILTTADMDKAIIIYTADHGQDFHERGNKGFYTHCSDSPNPEEGMVPLVIISGKKITEYDWIKNLAYNKNKSSHYSIFPTLLELMEYDKKTITEIYGPSLLDRGKDPYTFNANFGARLGTKPVWKKASFGASP